MSNVKKLLDELAEMGESNDASADSRSRKMLNITPDTGEYLVFLMSIIKAEDVLEVGTSNGYSTIWIAEALPDGGSVTTLEIQDSKIELAKANFERAGLADRIKQIKSDAGEFFRSNKKEYDLVFLDAERVEYMNFADEAVRAVRPGGILVCDNSISHADEMKDFMDYIISCGQFVTCNVPVGKGEFTACRK